MHARRLLVLLLLAPGCGSGGSPTSPVVRVDLAAKLPPAAQRRLSLADTSYECRHRFALAAGGASQRFVAVYRVFDEGAAKHVIAVAVEPEGETAGAGSPTASARVEEPRAGAVPVYVNWTATKGCSKVSAETRFTLRADAPGCAPPVPKQKLLVPVK